MKKLAAILCLTLIALAFAYNFANKYQSETKDIVLTWESEEIREENYSGSKPVIAGDNPLATAVRTYVESRIEEFAAQADIDVPGMRVESGRDSPAATYTIDISLSTLADAKTRSAILSEYAYTGGAHGSSSYKTITASRRTGKILTLGDIVKESAQDEFTELVKEKLLAWRPENIEGPVVFEEDVANLTFDSFLNWALDDENLILYFSQYEVGPGALGAFPFPIPKTELGSMIQ